jgi:integrase/recombinase XerC
VQAPDRMGGDVRKVQCLRRHRGVRVLERYEDDREDLAGGVARLVAGE